MQLSSQFWRLPQGFGRSSWTRRVANSALSTPRLGDTCLRDYHSGHHEHEQSLLQLKRIATSAQVLAYFKPD